MSEISPSLRGTTAGNFMMYLLVLNCSTVLYHIIIGAASVDYNKQSRIGTTEYKLRIEICQNENIDSSCIFARAAVS